MGVARIYNYSTGETVEIAETIVDDIDRYKGAVTNSQFRRGLRNKSLYDSFITYLGSAAPEFVDDWNYSPIIERDSKMVRDFKQSANLTNVQLDRIFNNASRQ